MSLQAVSRFYREARAVVRGPAAFGIELDGRPLATPAKRPLLLPSHALADAIAAEWRAQEGKLRPEEMPLTAIAVTALDLVSERRPEIVAELAAYGEHELCCYRAAEPEELVLRQQAVWQPLLDWAALHCDAPLGTTGGICDLEQSPEALAALRRALEALDAFRLSALAVAVRASGSLVISLALAAGRLDAAAAFEAAELEESYAIERWGEDSEAAARRAALKGELAAARRFLDLL